MISNHKVHNTQYARVPAIENKHIVIVLCNVINNCSKIIGIYF